MRTRTSPRLQESLWRQLGCKSQSIPENIDKADLAKRALADPFLSQRTRRMFERDLPKQVACPLCGEMNKGPGSLLGHLEMIHEDEWNRRKDDPSDEVVLTVKNIFANARPKRR